LNATLGIAMTCSDLSETLRTQLLTIQHALFRVGGDLATPLTKKEKQDRVAPEHVSVLEEWIVELESGLPPQQKFIIPGGSVAASHLHVSRTVCRRAERRVTALAAAEDINPVVQMYLNRLSDYLFLAARRANTDSGRGDREVEY
jgi:cob(I)alamin adenosyltransferase